MSAELIPFAVVTLRGTRHELDPSGQHCTTCGELTEWLLESGGEGSF